METLTTHYRGPQEDQQVDFHLRPTWVEGGDESLVLVASGEHVASEPFSVFEVSSFLGFMPGDEVEAAVDVVSADERVLYTRSLHKETRGIYDAWHKEQNIWVGVDRFKVTVTCRVNGPNRDGELKAFFEALVRIRLGEDYDSDEPTGPSGAYTSGWQRLLT